MTTWSGWAADFLAAASLPGSNNNVRFLNEWAANATHPSCQNNPNDLAQHIQGHSSNCGTATNYYNQHFQRYSSHLWARTGWAVEIRSGHYPHLVAALRSGNPYTYSGYLDVEGDLNRWGSGPFGAVYVNDLESGPPASLKAPQALSGWKALRKSVNRDMPAALRQSQKARQAALRSLSHARKVHR